jgi:hypothetical protein
MIPLKTLAWSIRDGPSVSSRKRGIEKLGEALADPDQWESAWRAVGGVKGLINIFSEISLTEVDALSVAIGRCNYGPQNRVKQREKSIEELLHALLPLQYPDSELQSHDNRPLQNRYAKMVWACSQEFIDQLLDSGDHSNPLYRGMPTKRLINTHGELLRKHVINDIFGVGPGKRRFHQYLKTLVYSQSRRVRPDSKVTGSMVFAERILQLRLGDINNDKRWPAGVSEVDLLHSLLQRSLRKRLPEVKLHDVFMLGLQILRAKPSLKPELQRKAFLFKLVARWMRAPSLYEELLALAFRLELGGSHKTIGQDYLRTITSFTKSFKEKVPELKWPLLRLYCLHTPKKGVDIDTAKDFKMLAEQLWPSDIFYHLSKNQAVRLLEGLHSANPNCNFLEGPTRVSILFDRAIISQQNFNVALLLTILQRNSKETEQNASIAINELRKEASIAREQLDRAQLVKAASTYAIASGSLDLYHDTVVWQQRYIRDPLTVKTIFGRDAVMTCEGVELLSGIPQESPESMTLAEIALRVGKANEILIIFHETMRMAKREPSFQKADWGGVVSLFGAAIRQRVDDAMGLHKRLKDPEADLYSAIWAGTLDMLRKVNVDFLSQAFGPIKSLLNGLPPTALAAALRAMLEAENENRSSKDRELGDDILERLSYETLRGLAQSDNPELAQQLILQTIINRPDASSWHRQLLSLPFMNSLNAQNAREMLLAFASAIGEKLEEQSYVKISDAQPPLSTPAPPLVKVTTVKYLAQLLQNAEFVSEDVAAEVLMELFMAGTHIDIRLATLASLLSVLNNICRGVDENWKSDNLVEKIMRALEILIPIVGSVNERRPLQREDWDEAREIGEVPEISGISDDLPPLLSAVFTALGERRYPGLKNLQDKFLSRLLLPILRYSQLEHRKWAILFLAKHNMDFPANDLPPTPISSKLWDILLGNFAELIPQTVLEDFNKHIVMTIAPSAALKTFNESLRNNAGLSNTPKVQHWLAVFGQDMVQYSSSKTQVLLSMIHHDLPRSLVSNGITFHQILDMIIEHASLFLDEYRTYTDTWNSFVDHLRPPAKFTYPYEDVDSIRSMNSSWQKSGRVVLEKVTALVIAKKKEHTRQQKLSILPSTTKLHLWLLPYPCFPSPAEVDTQCRSLAGELDGLLNTLLEAETSMLRLPRITKDACIVSKFLNTDEERLRVAIYLGKLNPLSSRTTDEKSIALKFILVTLAMKLIEDGQDGLKKTRNRAPEEVKAHMILVQCLKKKIEEWQNDSEEAIREMIADWRVASKNLWEIIMSGE